MTERIILASPREPCGATWLINCLLALGIKTYRVGPLGQKMWLKDSNGWNLDRREEVLKKWLPVLSQRKHFQFNDQLEVQWLHEWPTAADWQHRVMYFIRDPRDAMYSRYRREGASMPFKDYLDFPDAFSLLDKIDHWRAFNESWLEHPRMQVVRFEDYKANALQLLKQTMDWIGFPTSEPALEVACAASSFEKAAQAERQYLQNNGGGQLINRAGKSGEWRTLSCEADVMEKISVHCAHALRFFGYEAPAGETADLRNRPQFSRLRYFASIRLPVPMQQVTCSDDDRLRALIEKLDANLLQAAGMTDSETHVMLDRLVEYARAAGWRHSVRQLDQLYRALGITKATRWSNQKVRLRRVISQLLRAVANR